MKLKIASRKVLGLLVASGIWLSMLACGGGPTNPGNNTNNTSNNTNNTNNTSGLCGSGCPSGQFCWNGVCVVGCNTNAECAADQYCDTDVKQCANKKVSTCPDTPCGENQTCVNGYCSAKQAPAPKKKEESGACKPAIDGNDGCKSNEICLGLDDEQTQCRSFPRCPEDGKCPTGLSGAVCNDKLIPNKARICLVGVCKTNENCPSSWSCVMIGGSVLGFCSDGSLGQPCTKPEQCKQGFKCMQASPGTVGACLNTGIPDVPDFP